MRWPDLMARSLAGLVAFALSGCTTVSFLTQAGAGQLKVQTSARPLTKVIKNPDTTDETRQLLSLVPDIKEYAESQGLHATDSYKKYVDVNGDAVVWVVTACPEFSLRPKTWKFPIVGSFSYLGWFKKERAESHAAKLGEAGWDVHVRGAAAYSTLGWLNDPIFSTMMRSDSLGEALLAETILHESLHATVYINDQSTFNESLAQFVGEGMMQEYLEDKSDSVLPTARQWQDRRHERSTRMAETHDALKNLYQEDIAEEIRRERKREILVSLQEDLQLATMPNNASLAGARTYDTGWESFRAVLDSCDGDWMEFIRRFGGVTTDSFDQPQQQNFDAIVRKECL